MENQVMEYKCPCCDAGLSFDGSSQQLNCEYCGNNFDIEAVRAFNESTATGNTEDFQWEETPLNEWSEEENAGMHSFQCPSCGGEILCEDTTAASSVPTATIPQSCPRKSPAA